MSQSNDRYQTTDPGGLENTKKIIVKRNTPKHITCKLQKINVKIKSSMKPEGKNTLIRKEHR